MTATANSWKHKPFLAGRPIPYAESFSGPEYSKLREGLIPQAMEDKWFIYFDEPHLFLHRSWTGEPVFRVRLTASGDGAAVAEALCVSDLLQNGPEYQAVLLDFLIGNLLLGKAKPFPMPDGQTEQARGILQHHVSGTGYEQVPFKKR